LRAYASAATALPAGPLLSALLILLGLSTAVSAQFAVAPGNPFGTGTESPQVFAVGDFNGDGKLDIVVADSAGMASVYLGTGSGAFTPPSGSFAVGPSPAFIVVGDFNGDGNLDIAIANSTSNTITVLLGDSAGGFIAAPGSPFAVGSNPLSIAVGDFNGDGKLDLAVANYGSSSVTLLMGDGAGGFTLGDTESDGGLAGPSFIAVGDFNGDGRPDLAIANANSHTVSVLLGIGSGGFGGAPGNPFTLGGEYPQSLAVGDFNGDGKPDLAVGCPGSVTVLLGNGSGGFSPAPGSPVAVSSEMYSVAVGDFNMDGKQDLAIPSAGYALAVLLGNGSGGFSASPGSPFRVEPSLDGDGTGHLAVGDFNGDGKPDVVLGVLNIGSVTVLQNVFPALMISGQVALSGSGLSGVTMTLSGSQSGSAATSYSGGYTFPVQGGGSYTVTPSGPGLIFNPPSQTFKDLDNPGQNGSVVANFSIVPSYQISGQVTYSGSAAGGVTVVLSGSQSGSTTTNGSGNYSFAVQKGGSYTVAISGSDSPNPPGQTFNNLSGSQTANFSLTIPAIFLIGGQVTLSGGGLGGVTMTLSGATAGATTTNGSGSYSFLASGAGSYTITPSLSGYGFNPPSLTFSIKNPGGNQTANFSVTTEPSVPTVTISGTVSISGSGLSGVLMTLGGAQSGSATTNASGGYMLSGYEGASYTVTPSLSGFSFSPPSATFNNLGSGTLAASFTATVSTSLISVTNDASFVTSISPGSLVALFGNGNVLSGITASGFNTPLPTSSGGTSVTINGIYCPLVYVSPTQINLQAPMELAVGTATVVVNNNGTTFSATVQVPSATPGIFTSDYIVTAILQDGNGNLLTASSPASPGQSVAMYLTGIGPVSNYPGDGNPAPFGPLAQSTSSYTLTVNGTAAHIDYLGLAPGWTGLGQINFEIPAGTPAGNTIPVVLTIAGTASKTVQISVK
jgi:uncharacterized protein (TIGR03437 family)